MVSENCKSLQACQINISTLSSHSHTSLNYYNNRIKNDILAIQETMIDPSDTSLNLPSFQNMETFYLLNDRGVSLSIKASFAPQHISELEDGKVDAIWASFSYNT